MVDIELSVSDEMVESGRIYSTRSEKPTRTRGTTLGGDPSDAERVCSGLVLKSACDAALRLGPPWPKNGFSSVSRGVAGALPPRVLLSFGCMIVCKSWHEMAPDRRCR